jgi:DNA (cytosine-5)-methyltransferase 1
VAFSEIEPYACRVLKNQFPWVKNYGDIKNIRGSDLPANISLLTGGFPCQPYSVAGKQKGKDDDRALWGELCRVISEVQPRCFVGENVAGIINMGLDSMLSELEGLGYWVEACVVPACAVNAPHIRERVWILGYSKHHGSSASEERSGVQFRPEEPEGSKQIGQPSGTGSSPVNASDASNHTGIGTQGFGGCGQQESRSHAEEGIPLRGSEGSKQTRGNVVTGVWGMDDGLPDWMDTGIDPITEDTKGVNRPNRIKALGNAIVPQVAYEIIKSIPIL